MTEKELLKCRKKLLYYAKRRALKKGREFSLTLEDIIIPEFCPILGLKLGHGGDPKNSPSIGRISRYGGYTKDNILIISYCANVVRHLASPEEIITVGKFFRDHPTNKESRKSRLLKDLIIEKEKLKKLRSALMEAAYILLDTEEVMALEFLLNSKGY